MVDYVFAVRSPLEWHAEKHATQPLALRAAPPRARSRRGGRDRRPRGRRCPLQHARAVARRRGRRRNARAGTRHALQVRRGEPGYAMRRSHRVALAVPGRSHAETRRGVGSRRRARGALRAAVAAAAAANLRAALAAALPTLPETFSAEALRVALCGLSYRGDARTWLGAEDRHKVARVAAGSAAAIDALYARAAAEARAASVGLTRVEGRGTDERAWGQDKEPGGRALPVSLAAPLGARRARGDGRSGSGAGRRGHGGGARAARGATSARRCSGTSRSPRAVRASGRSPLPRWRRPRGRLSRTWPRRSRSPRRAGSGSRRDERERQSPRARARARGPRRTAPAAPG